MKIYLLLALLLSFREARKKAEPRVITVQPQLLAKIQESNKDPKKFMEIEAYACLKDNQIILDEKQQGSCLAKALFKSQIYSKGWDTLYLEMFSSGIDGNYAIGALEGALTSGKIITFVKNYILKSQLGISNFDFKNPEKESNSIYKNTVKTLQQLDEVMEDYMDSPDSKNDNEKRLKGEFKNISEQFQGILDGYNVIQKDFPLTRELLHIINYGGGISELTEFSNSSIKNKLRKLRMNKNPAKTHLKNVSPEFKHFMDKSLRGRCTVVFKFHPDTHDVLMSHVTMDSYDAMQRMFKYLKTPNYEYQYSSYPATISSTDDFFEINKHLIVTETSLSSDDINSKKEEVLTKNNDPEFNYKPEYMKVTASSRLAKSAKDWVSLMKTFRGGIYVSQWMVFDQNEFDKQVKGPKAKVQAKTNLFRNNQIKSNIDQDQVKDNQIITELNKINKKTSQNTFFEIMESFSMSSKKTDRLTVRQEYNDILLVFEDQFQNKNHVDKSTFLINEQYFGSANRFLDSKEASPRQFSYDRLKIIMDHNRQVKDLASLAKFMGTNKQIPFDDSKKTIQQKEKSVQDSMMYRFDQVNKNILSGGIDMKVTNSRKLKKGECFTRNGPQGQFQFPSPIQGMPQSWDFNFIKISQKTMSTKGN